MTSSRFYIARFVQAFGFFQKNLRMSDAASEMHLLREAEAQLGELVWEKVESIEELSVEYWNLRKLSKEREIVQRKLNDDQVKLDLAYEERMSLLNSTPEVQQALVDKRVTLLQDLENLAMRRDQIVVEARDIRRAYDGMKMKLEVMLNEQQESESKVKEIEKVKARLVELKNGFAELKRQRVKIAQELEAGDARIDLVDAKLEEYRKDQRRRAAEVYDLIGERNKEISILRSEKALLDTQMRQLHAEIGRFVSRNTHQHPGCSAAVQSHRALVEVMRALRRSIALNHRLAGIA
jgi:chromosome segregation ATPase